MLDCGVSYGGDPRLFERIPVVVIANSGGVADFIRHGIDLLKEHGARDETVINCDFEHARVQVLLFRMDLVNEISLYYNELVFWKLVSLSCETFYVFFRELMIISSFFNCCDGRAYRSLTSDLIQVKHSLFWEVK